MTTINILGLDARYTISLEYDGNPTVMHVVRFCGDYLSSHKTLELAKESAFLDYLMRDLVNCGYTVLTECEGVTLFKSLKRRQFKVVYGAEVKNFNTIEESLDHFKCCIWHSLECDSKLD